MSNKKDKQPDISYFFLLVPLTGLAVFIFATVASLKYLPNPIAATIEAISEASVSELPSVLLSILASIIIIGVAIFIIVCMISEFRKK